MRIPTQKNNYDLAASFYDRLAHFIFGRTISESQFSILRNHFPGPRIVIAGGGTGAILEELARIKRFPLNIIFIELSGKMLDRATKRNTGCHTVEFICGDAARFNASHALDVIITPFLFDNFTAAKATEVFNSLNGMLCPGGIWLFTDFNLAPENAWWQRLLLKLMYCFFKILARVEAWQLPDTVSLFLVAGYVCEREHFFYHNFIRSAVYRKPKIDSNLSGSDKSAK